MSNRDSNARARRESLAQKQAAAAGQVLADAVVRYGPDRYRVAVLQVDHRHRWQIELNGVIVAGHEGARPEAWPGEQFPPEVLEAVTDVALQLSWS